MNGPFGNGPWLTTGGVQARLNAGDITVPKASIVGDAVAFTSVDQSFETRTAFAAASITNAGTTVNTVVTGGDTAAGDGRGGRYRYSAFEPAHEGKVQSADGAWWELVVEPDVRTAIGTELAAVDVFLIYGQSNAKGTAPNTTGAPARITRLATMWQFSTSEQVAMANIMPTPLDGNSTGGWQAAFANEYVARTGRRCLFVNCAKGSQSITELSKGDASGNYTALVAAHDAVVADIVAVGNTVGNVSVIFWQGEEDAADGTGYHDYLAALETLWTNIKLDTTATTFFNITFSHRQLTASWPFNWGIQAAQRVFCAETADAVTCFDHADTFWQHSGLRDGTVHYTQAGYNIVGREAAKTVAERLFDGTAPASSQDYMRHKGLNVSTYQQQQLATAVLQKTSGSFALNFGTGYSSSMIAEIDITTDANEMRLILPQPATQVISFGADLTAYYKRRGLTVGVGNIYNATESAEVYIPLRFYLDARVLVNMTTGAISINGLMSDGTFKTMFDAVVSAAFITGQATLTHTEMMAYATGTLYSSSSNRSVRVVTSSTTQTIVQTRDTSNALVDELVVVHLPNLLIPPANLPDNLRLSTHAIFSTYRT